MERINSNEAPFFFASSPYCKDHNKFAAAVCRSGGIPILILPTTGIERDSAIKYLNSSSFQQAVYFTSIHADHAQIKNPDIICIAPAGMEVNAGEGKIIYEVTTAAQAAWAMERDAFGLILKGNEAAGKVGSDSTFILLQKLIKSCACPIWVKGGIGIHTASAALALGAHGVVLEDECYLLPEFGLPTELKKLVSRLDGSETRIIHSHRVYINQPYWPKEVSKETVSEKYVLERLAETVTGESPVIAFGQGIGLAKSYKEHFSNLDNFLARLEWSVSGHLRQAQHFSHTKINQRRFQADFGVAFPIAQGPMTRVSDLPEFIAAVANEGALPFFALALLQGKNALDVLQETSALLEEKKWGVGVLGFIDEQLQEEQFNYIKSVVPPFVLVAGGSAATVKKYESIGALTFIHAPSEGLLDIFLREGIRNFVFEGRECGGHVGPLSSFVLWEKQINRLLQEEDLSDVTVYFAGGIHDEFSSAFVSIMAAPLIALGVKVGVLMGTAYLYTDEAVASGAIQQKYQDETLRQTETALLETSSGHIVRCLATPYVDHFNRVKRSLRTKNLDSKTIERELEALNTGRLRVATKGIKRTGQGLEPVAEDEQFQEGLYMVGQVSTMDKTKLSVKALHDSVCSGADCLLVALAEVKNRKVPSQSPREGIAIIGMASILPDARNVQTYWNNILENHNSITEVPASRWDTDKFFDPNAKKGVKSNSKWGGFIPEIEFDPTDFGIPPQSLAAIDPAQLLSLQATKEALIDAGYWENDELDRENTAVIFGLEGGSDLLSSYELRATLPRLLSDLPDEVYQVLPSLTEDSFSGTLPNVIAGRIANRLDFRGRNFVVDAACASSLAALDVACQELNTGRANAAVVGAVDLHNNLIDYLKFSSVGALSNEGICKAFADDASGIALGEGVGVVILKRLGDAVRDGDRIYSVIKGIGSSSDGRSLGLTAPRKSGQMMAYQRAYIEANINPATVGLIEGHGTGTVVGDKTELQSLTDFFIAAGSLNKQITLGSVKTQIGHTKCAAGLAALIKTSLSIFYGIKPATLHLQSPNSAYHESSSPFELRENATIWQNKRRVAGVSAFGFGGTNFHVVMQNHDEQEAIKESGQQRASELFVLRARSNHDLSDIALNLIFLLEKESEISLADLAYTLATTGTEPIQATIVAKDHADLIKKLRVLAKGNAVEDLFYTKPIDGKTAFLFSGQGSQKVNMLKDLYLAFPQMRPLLAKHNDLKEILFPERTFDSQLKQTQITKINLTENCQPILGIVDLTIAKLLNQFGIVADELAGHSYGEIPALTHAGVIREEDLVSVSRARAYSILSAAGEDPGSMVALDLPEDELKQLIKSRSDLYLANHNSERQWILAGPSQAINEFVNEWQADGKFCKKLPVACAFHSPIIARAKEFFAYELGNIALQKPSIPVWSNTSVSLYPQEENAIKNNLCEHLIRPVRFFEQIQKMYESGARIFIEVGPGKVLKNLTSSILRQSATVLPVDSGDDNGVNNLNRMLARYIASGRSIIFNEYFSGRRLQTLDLITLKERRKKNVLWKLRGHRTDPLFMPIPSHASRELVEPIILSQILSGTYQPKHEGNNVKEKLVLEYLANVRALIEAQQNVVMSYLGTESASIPDTLLATHTSQISAMKHAGSALGGLQKSYSSIPLPAIESPKIEKSAFPAAKSAGSGKAEIKTKIYEVICDKTGYPMDMLDGAMDLEADLSIDSIKRAEIIGSLAKTFPTLISPEGKNASQQALAKLKNINQLVEMLSSMDSPAVAEDISANNQSTHDAFSNQVSGDDISRLLMNIVEAKTGYPLDMLEMDMDLEADLSIDSIKRAEILNTLSLQLAERHYSLDKSTMSALAGCKTLRALESVINKTIYQDTEHKSNNVKKQLAATNEPHSRVSRYNFSPIETACTKTPGTVSVRGKKIGILEDGSDETIMLHGHLSRLGADVEIFSRNSHLTHLQGVICLDLSSSKSKLSYSSLFEVAKSVDPEKLEWFFTVTDVYSRLELMVTPEQVLDELCGSYGFINSLNKEWSTVCREIQIGEFELEQLPELVSQELCRKTKDEPVVNYQRGTRFTSVLTGDDWDRDALNIELHSDDVVLVLGGAQGITAEILKEFSSRNPCHLILVGRTATPGLEAEARSDLELTKSIADIKKDLLRNKTFKTPKELELHAKQQFKQNQLIITKRSLTALGSKVSYHSCDLTDSASLTELIASIYKTYGKLDGIIHAAGHLEDKLIVDKTYESFTRVIQTKTAPLKVLIRECKPSLKYFVLFSSVTSVFGNRGQIDYGTANAIFDQLAHALNNILPGRFVAINWGPWKGKGMIDQSLENDFLKRGVTLIPVEQGAAAFIDELQYGSGGQAILMTPVANMSKATEQF